MNNHNQNHNDHQHNHGHQHGGSAHQHRKPNEAAQLVVATEPATPVAGQPVKLRLMIHAADGTMVRDFDAVHQEKVHLVVVRDGLDQFAHVHPTVDANGNLTVSHTFPAGGTYRLFADYTPRGGRHATAQGVVTVGGQSPPAPALVPNAPGAVTADGVHATVAAAPLDARSPAQIIFALRDERGEPVKLETYMGVRGHLMFVSAGTRRYVHVHPAGGDAAPGKVEFEARFPDAGLYKGWGQFKLDGRVRVVPFVVKVE